MEAARSSPLRLFLWIGSCAKAPLLPLDSRRPDAPVFELLRHQSRREKESASYRSIAAQIGMAPSEILFLTDSIDEFNAAKEAGMQVVLLSRDGVPSDGQSYAADFYEIALP